MSSPAVGQDGTIYLGTNQGKVLAVSSDRRILWEYQTGGKIDSSPAIGPDGVVYIGSSDGWLYALNPNGQLKWFFATSSPIETSPAIGADGSVYFTNDTDTVYAVAGSSGQKKWEFVIEESSYIQTRYSPVVGSDGTVYFLAQEADPITLVSPTYVHALSANGKTKWVKRFDYYDPLSSPILGPGNKIYLSMTPSTLAYYKSDLYALDSEGEILWFSEGYIYFGNGSPVIDNNGVVYVPAREFPAYYQSGGVVAINPDGSERWFFETKESVHLSPAIGNDGLLYFGTDSGEFYVLDSLGTQHAVLSIVSSEIRSSPVISEGSMYFQAGGRLFFLEVDSRGLMQSGWPMFRQDSQHTARIGSTSDEADPALVGPVPSGRSILTGETMTIPVTVTNGGSASASDVEVTHPVPSFLDYLSPSVTGGGTCSHNQLSGQAVCSLGTIAAGSQKTINFSFEGNAKGSTDVTVQLTTSSADSDTSNNEFIMSYEVVGPTSRLHMPTVLLGPPAGFPENSFVGIAIHNPGEQPTNVSFAELGGDGSVGEQKNLTELTGSGLPVGGQFARLSSEIFPVSEEKPTLQIEGHSGDVEGFFLVGDGINYLDGVSGDFVEGNRLYFPSAKASLTDSTKLFLYNPDQTEDVQVSLEYFGTNGQPLDSALILLKGNGSWSGNVRDVFDLDLPADGYIRAVGSSPYSDSAMPIKGFELFSNGQDLSGLIGQETVASETFYVPHFVVWRDGSGLNSDTELSIVNPGAKTLQLTITLYDDQGNPEYIHSELVKSLETFQKKMSEVIPAGDQTDLRSGFIEVQLTVPSDPSVTPEIVGSVTFSTNHGQSLASLPLSSKGALESHFLHVAQIADIFTGLALLNPSASESADVQVVLYDEEGTIVETHELQVLPRTKVVGLLSEMFEKAQGRSGGHFEVISTQPVIAYALFGQMRGRYLSVIQAQGD